jgi:hypothetical protein
MADSREDFINVSHHESSTSYNENLCSLFLQCNPGGCLMELCIQLAIIMIGKQAYNTVLEMVIP